MRLLLFITILISTAISAFATNVIVLSDEGWCTVYLDGDIAGEIPLNSTKTTIKNVSPGSYQIKITDAFGDIWYKGVLEVPDADKILLQTEPGFFEVVSVSGNKSESEPEEEPEIEPEEEDIVGNVRTYLSSYPLEQIKNLLYITSTPTGAEVSINGKEMGRTPYAAIDLKPGDYYIEVKPDKYEAVEENVKVKEGSVTHIKIEVE